MPPNGADRTSAPCPRTRAASLREILERHRRLREDRPSCKRKCGFHLNRYPAHNMTFVASLRIHSVGCVYAGRCVYAPDAAFTHMCLYAGVGAYTQVRAYTHPRVRIRG